MAELSGRKAIAEYLGVPCNQVYRLLRRRLPVMFQGRRMAARTEGLDAWKKEHGDRVTPDGSRTV
jgi:hypothetical protein